MRSSCGTCPKAARSRESRWAIRQKPSISADGKWLSAAIEENDQVLIIDTASSRIDRRIAMKGKNPEHAVWSPDGRWIYASAEEADSVDIIDVAKGEVVKSVKVGDRLWGIGFLCPTVHAPSCGLL